MNRRVFTVFSTFIAILMLGLTGCSRTIDDIAKWKTKGNIEKLIRALEDPKSEIRLAAAEALGELKAESAVDPLASLFDDPEPATVLAAVNALSSIGNDPAASHLILALKLKSAEAREVAATALGTLKTTKAADDLAIALDDSEEKVALAAALALGKIGVEKTSAALVAKLQAPSDQLRLACVESLANTGGETAAEGLIGAMADKNSDVRKAAIASLLSLADLSTPYALEALRNDRAPIRKGAIAVLKGLDAIPTEGSDSIWFQLAKVSIAKKAVINRSVVQKLAQKGEAAVDTLLEATAHNVASIREHAFRALEIIGEPCTGTALEAAELHASADASAWLKNRSTWPGAPSWRIDLWAALAALNPKFELDSTAVANMQSEGRNAFRVIAPPTFNPSREYIPLLINLLGDQTVPPPEQPDVDKDGIPIIKKARDTFRGEANQKTSKDKLIAAGDAAVLPLISASAGSHELVAENAAEALGEIGDKRAVQPLIDVLSKKIEAGEELTHSSFYNALQKLDDPTAEPVLLKVRPNADRAMRVFERKYAEVRVMSADSRNASSDYTQPITFYLGYISGARLIETPVTFTRNESGDWKPTPPLPDQLPQ
jgi:HEAT repeat protein